jgi:hypothetical protein
VLDWQPDADLSQQLNIGEYEDRPFFKSQGSPPKRSRRDKDKTPDIQEEPAQVEERKDHDMLFELHRLFRALQESKKERGAFNHRKFMLAIKATNALFDNDEHHDSHEFINWLLDSVHESFVKH